MNTTRVPAFIYHVVCFGCGTQVAVPLFDGGGFYNFGTYRGPKTGRFYRLDLDRVSYLKLSREQELGSAAAAYEDGAPLELVPETMRCPHCGEPLGLAEPELRTNVPTEQAVEAVLL